MLIKIINQQTQVYYPQEAGPFLRFQKIASHSKVSFFISLKLASICDVTAINPKCPKDFVFTICEFNSIQKFVDLEELKEFLFFRISEKFKQNDG
jgi:hypothetical protein